MCGECKFCDSVGCTICYRKRINELETVLVMGRDEFFRGDIDSEGRRAVNLGSSIWHTMCDAIESK